MIRIKRGCGVARERLDPEMFGFRGNPEHDDCVRLLLDQGLQHFAGLRINGREDRGIEIDPGRREAAPARDRAHDFRRGIARHARKRTEA
jgi:hypothetical protein